MQTAVNAELPGCEVFIGVAAVADYRPARAADLKIKKEAQKTQHLSLSLVENPDIIASVAASAHKPFVVGFAAETHNVLDYARSKRVRKGLDIIIVNDVSVADCGFNSVDNAATMIWGGSLRDKHSPPLSRSKGHRCEHIWSRGSVPGRWRT